jgi:proliferating cell nuclear antigen PCNA
MSFIISESKKAIKFTAIIQHLKQFTTNILLNFKPTGIYIQCLDDSHCCLFDCSITKEWFGNHEDSYSVGIPKSIGINLNLFHKVLNARQETQSIQLIFDDKNEDIVSIHFINGTGGQFNKYFELSLINLDVELMDIKLVDTLVDLTMITKTFCEMINQFMIFDDLLTITFNEDVIGLTASGSEGKMRTEIKLEDVKEYVTAEGVTLKQSYSLRYINMMCNFGKLSNELYMGFSDTMPMHMKYELGDNSFANFHLAPKIVDDDE